MPHRCVSVAKVGRRQTHREADNNSSVKFIHATITFSTGIISEINVGADLSVRPSNCAQKNIYLVEVIYILQFRKNAAIQIRFHIENSLAPVLDFDIDSKIRKWFDDFGIPVHGSLRGRFL